MRKLNSEMPTQSGQASLPVLLASMTLWAPQQAIAQTMHAQSNEGGTKWRATSTANHSTGSITTLTNSAPHSAPANTTTPAKATAALTDTETHKPATALRERGPAAAISALRKMRLQVPLEGFNPESIKGSFYERRGGTLHHAADFLAQRNTPIHAVGNGPVAKLFESKPGGHTVYQFDPSEKYVFYYAHLEKYANGLAEGQQLKRGDIIGYVGTSGNAPPDRPHLHFSVGMVAKPKTWWKTIDLDPYEVFQNGR